MLFSRNELKLILHQLSTNDPDLTALHLSHKKITNRQLLQISDALATNNNVTEVWLTNNFISDDADTNTGSAGSVGYLMNVLETNRSVTEVYLGGNKIGAKGGKTEKKMACSRIYISWFAVRWGIISASLCKSCMYSACLALQPHHIFPVSRTIY